MTQNKKDMSALFVTLDRISQQDRRWVLELTDAELKELQPLVLQRWLSGTTAPGQLYSLNETSNPYVFELSSHKKLQLYLLIAASMGRKQKYSWTKVQPRTSRKPMSVELVSRALTCSSQKAEDALLLMCEDDVVVLAHDYGYDDAMVKAVIKEWK